MNSLLKYTALAAALTVATASQAETPKHGNDAPAADAHGRPIAAAALPQAGKPAANEGHGPAWTYEGSNGPDAWMRLAANFAVCGTGQTQSPIDIVVPEGVSIQPIAIDYRLTPMTIVNNGHTVQVNYEPGSSITVKGKRFELL